MKYNLQGPRNRSEKKESPENINRTSSGFLEIFGFTLGLICSAVPALSFAAESGNSGYTNGYNYGYGMFSGYGGGMMGGSIGPTNIVPHPEISMYNLNSNKDYSAMNKVSAATQAIQNWVGTGDSSEIDESVVKFSGIVKHSDPESIPGQFAANQLSSLMYRSAQAIADYERLLADPNTTEVVKSSFQKQIENNQRVLTRLKAEMGDRFDKEWQRQKSEVGFVDSQCLMEKMKAPQQNSTNGMSPEPIPKAADCKTVSFDELLHRYPHLNETLERQVDVSKLRASKKTNGSKTEVVATESCSLPESIKKTEPNTRCDLTQLHQLVEAIKNNRGPAVNVWSTPVEGIGQCERIRLKWDRRKGQIEFAYIEAFYGDELTPVPFTTAEIAAFKEGLGLSPSKVAKVELLEKKTGKGQAHGIKKQTAEIDTKKFPSTKSIHQLAFGGRQDSLQDFQNQNR